MSDHQVASIGMSDASSPNAETRLWELIERRTHDDADVAAIDEEIWGEFGEQWAVMFTDLSGFSRDVATFGILHFLQMIFEHQRVVYPIIDRHCGRVVKVEADSLMVLFSTAVDAIRCAVAMQDAMRTFNQTRTPTTELLLCIGVGYGDILRIGDTDVWGQQVNAASKLGEDTAKAWEILLTDEARSAAKELWSDEAALRCELLDSAESTGGSAANYRLEYLHTLV